MGAIRSTKIVATIGPASREPEVLRRMVDAGMDVARLNFAHGSPEQHAESVELIRSAAGAAGREVAVLQDVPGPKLRLGPIPGDVVQLSVGSDVTLVPAENGETGNGRLPVAWPGFAELVEPEQVVYLADGAVRLRVREVRERRSAPASRWAARSPRGRGSTCRTSPSRSRPCPARTWR
jgi:pyruvate kinase